MNKDGFWWDIKQTVYEPEFSNLKGKSDQGNTVGGGSAVNTISSLFVILLSVIVTKLLPMRRGNLVSRMRNENEVMADPHGFHEIS